MSFRAALSVCLGACWFSSAVLLSSACAQVQALPAYTAGTEQPRLPYNSLDQHQAPRYETPAARPYPAAPLELSRRTVPPYSFPSQQIAFADSGAGDAPATELDVEIEQPGAWDGRTYRPPYCADCRMWQILPEGLMYKSYLAGGREPRFASKWFYEKHHGWLWDSTLGGRVGVLRYGTPGPVNPQGWQLDLEGAAFPRLDMENGRELVSADFRFGIPLTTRQGPWEAKFAYYHLSSHLGDEYMVRYPAATRINYARDCLVLGLAVYPNPDVRLYAEAGWAFFSDGGAMPWEFQFGIDYSPAQPSGCLGAPFFAVNGNIREEVDYGGNFTVEAGWQWRGRSEHLMRLGMYYYNGMSDQYQFFDQFEERIGIGLWYDY